MIDWKLLEAQGIKRSGNKGKGSPFAFLIVGIDISESDLLAKFPDDAEAQDIIRKGGKDSARLRDEIPGWFVRNLKKKGSKPPAIHVFQLLERNAKGKVVASWPIVLDGRSRMVVLRQDVKEGEEAGDARAAREVEAEIHAYNKSEGAGFWALQVKSRMNQSIQESLLVKAERAADFADSGISLVQIADEIGMDFGDPETEEGRARIERKVKDLLKWNEIANDLCEEARERVKDGRLRLKGAQELVKKFTSKSEQADYFAGKTSLRGDKSKPRPVSPRLHEVFSAEIAKEVKRNASATGGRATVLGINDVDAFTLGMRLALGDKAAAKELPDPLRAAWLRANEAAKTRRKAAE